MCTCTKCSFASASHLTLSAAFVRVHLVSSACCLRLFCGSTNTYGPQVWETESAGIFNLTECVEEGEIKCAKYWPDFGEPEEFVLGDGSSIFVRRIAKDPLQDIDKGPIDDKKKFEIRTFRLEYDGMTREVTQYHVKFWKDNAGLLGDGQAEMRNFLHFLVEQVDAHCRNMDSGPPIIHCRQVHLPCAQVNSTDIRSCSYL